MNIQKFFWTSLVTLIFGFIFVSTQTYQILVLSPKDDWLTDSDFIIFCTISLAVLLFLNFIFDLVNKLKLQKKRNQPSWVYYGFTGLALGPVTVTIIFLLILRYIYYIPFDFTFSIAIKPIFFNAIFSLFTTLFLFLLPKKIISNYDRFASGAVGIDLDSLDFKSSAKNVADGLLKINRYVSVVALYGELGFGKSSYARMIVESFDQKQILYTYISLTETNEAKDLSKLFAERWIGTLNERYPKMDTSLALPFMQSILRETGNSFIATFFSIFPGLNRGLSKTKVKFFDEFYKPEKDSITSNDVASLFGNIPEIHEDLWIIMVDEIERAQFDEIYRLIEIIERFKNEGRTGVPIKIMFFLCISHQNFQNLIKTFKDSDPRAYLINQFFYDDPKSITHTLFLPPVNPARKKDYIVNKFKDINSTHRYGIPENLEDIYFDNFSDPTSRFFDTSTSLSYTLGLFNGLSPRLISRCIQGVNFFYGAFKAKTGGQQNIIIRTSDLLIMEYIKIKYPYLLLFFEKTINYLLLDYNVVGGGESHDGVSSYFYRERFKENKLRLADWVSEDTDTIIPDNQKKEVEKIIGLVAFCYIDFKQGNHGTKNGDLYYDSLALPKNLYDYLSIVSDAVVTSFDYYNQIHLKYRGGDMKLEDLSNIDFVGYSRFIDNISTLPTELHVEILNEIAKRILEKKIPIIYKDTGDTLYDSYIYQFIFQLTKLIEKQGDTGDKPSQLFEAVYTKLREILYSENVNTGAKYIILNSLTNNSRGNGSEIHYRMQNAFSKIMRYYEKDFKKSIAYVFEEAEKRYFIDGKIIYENEENFFYVMYQGWSGKKDNLSEIKKIRDLAEKDLQSHPDAIIQYWSRYEFDKEWQSFTDVLRDDPFFSHNSNFELYMPLKNLVINTMKNRGKIQDNEVKKKLEFWKKCTADEKYIELAKLKDDPTTLKAVLIVRGLLKA